MNFFPQVELDPRTKRLIVIILMAMVSYLRMPMMDRYGYDAMLDAEAMNIYQGDELIGTIHEPGYVIDPFKEKSTVAIISTSARRLGLSRLRMRELYRLEFVTNGKATVRLKVLTPRNQRAIDKMIERGKVGTWYEVNGHYVVLKDGDEYFHFVKDFYKELSEVLQDSVIGQPSTNSSR